MLCILGAYSRWSIGIGRGGDRSKATSRALAAVPPSGFGVVAGANLPKRRMQGGESVMGGLSGGFRLRNRRWYAWLFILLCVGLIIFVYVVGKAVPKIEWVVSILGGVGGLTTFLYTQHLQETRLFTELFQKFNERYDELNQPLGSIAEAGVSGIHGERRQTLIDYFNLCAEEYLYFSAGYIDAAAWRSWARGMKYYADVPAIREIWEQELAKDSYYGFSLRQLEAT
jgi:hypothetical protein